MRRFGQLLLICTLCLSGCRSRPPLEKPEEPSLSIEVDAGTVRLEPGLSTKVRINITRVNLAEELKVELKDLPAGMSSAPVTVGPQDTFAEVELTSAPNAMPAEKKTAHAVALSSELRAKSKAFNVGVSPPSINFAFEPTHLKIPKGESRPLKISVQRGRDAFQGAIEIALASLPKNVTATAKGKGPDGVDWMGFSIQAGASALEGDSQPLVRVIGDKQLRGVGLFPLTVQGDPFVLQVEPARIQVAYGKSAKLKITATRKDYQGPIAVRLDGLPPGVQAKPFSFAAKQSTAEIEVLASADAGSAEKSVQVRGNADDKRQASAKFEVKVEGRPFTLQLQPARLEIVQGSAGKLKVIAQRAKDFSGPIDLELRGLPKNCKVSPSTLTLTGKDVEIDITTDDAAPLGDAAVQVIASTSVAGEKRELPSSFALAIVPTFSLQLQPGKIELLEGQKATIKVNAIRRTYKGAIAIELRNLPGGVVAAAEAEIPRDKNSTEIELTAGPGSSGKIKSDVHALGMAFNKKQGTSGNVTVLVLSKLFELKVDKAVKLTYGSKAYVKVSAMRHDYQGRIALDLKNLPPHVKASKAMIPAGQSETDIEVTVADDAKEFAGKAHLIGTATAAGNQQRPSEEFDIQVVPGQFELKIEPPLLQLHHNSTGKIIVTAKRKGHDGPITVELKNLPATVKAEKATIAKGENRVEIEVKAPATVTEGAKVDVFARGAVTGKNIDSDRMVVNIASIGQEPMVQLKVDSTSVKLVPGGSAKLKLSAIRKGYNGAIAVELRNLPPDIEATKGMITAGGTEVEITLTAKAKAEPIMKTDVCGVGLAVAAENRPYATPQITVQVGRK